MSQQRQEQASRCSARGANNCKPIHKIDPCARSSLVPSFKRAASGVPVGPPPGHAWGSQGSLDDSHSSSEPANRWARRFEQARPRPHERELARRDALVQVVPFLQQCTRRDRGRMHRHCRRRAARRCSRQPARAGAPSECALADASIQILPRVARKLHAMNSRSTNDIGMPTFPCHSGLQSQSQSQGFLRANCVLTLAI